MRKIIFLFTLLNALLLTGQVKQQFNKDLTQEDSIALVTVANYPDSIKKNIFEACQKPDFLIKTESLQKNTSHEFRALMEEQSKQDQKYFWDLTRYPGLTEKMTNGEKKSKEELEIIAAEYPKEIRPVIVECGRNHYKVLNDINSLNQRSNSEFEKIIANYPESTKASFRELTNHPDVLNTLAGNMHLSVILGNMYSEDPKQSLHMLDSIKTIHATQNAKDFEDWKNGLEKDPVAKKELEQASKEFITDKESDPYLDDVYYTPGSSSSKPPVYNEPPAVNYVVYPYPYWFGYPWWFDYPYWYPYPYWYNSGFYWGPSGMVFVGLPSPFFMNWYFFHPYHHYYYSHFSDYCLGYHSSHYGPRFQRSGFNSEIHRWSQANEPNLPNGYLKSDAGRQSRIKELGRFEMDYHNNTKAIFGRNVTRSEFLKNNSGYYPTLNRAIGQPNFNQPIKYPSRQNPTKFNMGNPGKLPSMPKAPINVPRQGMPRGGGIGGGAGRGRIK